MFVSILSVFSVDDYYLFSAPCYSIHQTPIQINKHTKRINCKTKAGWTWLFCSTCFCCYCCNTVCLLVCCGSSLFLTNNIEGKITECWLINEGGIYFLILHVKRAKLLAHDWSSCCLATAHAIKKLFFCNNGVSFQDSWRGIYRRIKGQEWKWKHEE